MRASLLLLLPLALAACKLDMERQRRFNTFGQAAPLPHGAEAQLPPEGTVPRGAAARAQAASVPPPVTAALLARGRERFDIACAPCHGPQGDGDGMIPRRGFPHPPSYHSARLRAAPADYIYGVITKGYGVMYGYADRVEPADRWAIIAYIRALQLSRSVDVAAVPDVAGHLP